MHRAIRQGGPSEHKCWVRTHFTEAPSCPVGERECAAVGQERGSRSHVVLSVRLRPVAGAWEALMNAHLHLLGTVALALVGAASVQAPRATVPEKERVNPPGLQTPTG